MLTHIFFLCILLPSFIMYDSFTFCYINDRGVYASERQFLL